MWKASSLCGKIHVSPCPVNNIAHFEYLLNNLWDRINAEDYPEGECQYQHLKLELIKSMGQTICYEILNMYFTNQLTAAFTTREKRCCLSEFHAVSVPFLSQGT